MSKGRRTKKIVVIADLHSGHVAGLTPPTWQFEAVDENPLLADAAKMRAQMWQAYRGWQKTIGKPDVLIVNGDCIEGPGYRSGGTELLTADQQYQCDIAAECIKLWKAPTILMTYGTPYHTGFAGQDWERLVAKEVGAEHIKAKFWPLEINGCIFDVKHKIGASSIPHGRHTAIAREKLWNGLWADHESQPKAKVIIRSHVHYYVYAGGAGWFGVVTPALQAPATKYGGRECSGTVDFGLLCFFVNPSGEYDCNEHLLTIDGVVDFVSV